MTDLLDRRKALHRRIEDAQSRCVHIEEQMEQIQPLAALGLNWAMTAHEMNNLLMPIGNYARLAIANPQDGPLLQKSLDKILKLSERAALVMEKVMSIASPAGGKKECHNVGELLDDVFLCIGRDFAKDKIHVIRQMSQPVHVFAEKISLEQVFLNLILNGRQALLGRGGVLTITAEPRDEQVSIEISDNGPGIDADHLSHIFDPFFTRGKQNGKGLGLAFCRKIVEAHGGCISVESQVGQGTRFRILLPKETL
ncbi:MAG: hypothetical protein LLF76_08370 [Planctomycetaceae bacterium]|nr:hypothetical protein [Planctomycetaceae bacterium]